MIKQPILCSLHAKGYHKKGKEDIKEIYSFNIVTGKLSKKPDYKIRIDELERFMNKARIDVPVTMKENSFFEPSEIAVHPVTNDLFVLSSVGKMIVVLDRSGKIKDVALLDPNIAAHPEGMTFSNDGTLFISSEGNGRKKVILEFVELK